MKKNSRLLMLLMLGLALFVGTAGVALAAEGDSAMTDSAEEEKPVFIDPADTIEDQKKALDEYLLPILPKEIRKLPDTKVAIVTAEMADVLVIKSGLNVNLTSNDKSYAVASIEGGEAVITVLQECTAWDDVKATLTLSRKDDKGQNVTVASYSISVIGAIEKATDIEMLPEPGTKILLHSKTSRVAGYVLEKNILDPTVTYKSLNPEIALVDRNTGVLTPVAVGKVTIKMDGGLISKRLEIEIVKDKK